jgi:NAD(P)-dependent dehydrogenase (short-subunit alcohol dehydrogenase family)
MGRAYADAFIARGARVAALDRAWDTAPLEGALVLRCDVTNPIDVMVARDRTLERFQTIDVLINNAAMRQRDLFPPHGAAAVLDTTHEQWQRMFDVNVFGVLRLIREFAPAMIAQQRGSIVNIASSGSVGVKVAEGVWAGRNPGFRNQPYDASKAALTNMSFFLADELRPANVAVNAVFPAATRTTGSDEMVAGRAALGIRVSRLLRPEHVVPLVLHLAAQDASGDTGQAFDAVRWNQARGFGGPEAWTA